MGIGPLTWAHRLERSTAERNMGGKSRGGTIVFHLRKKRLPYEWKPETRDMNKIREGNASVNCGNPFLPGILSLPGDQAARAGEGILRRPRSPSWMRRLFFHRRHRELLCVGGVARLRGRRGFGGARESRFPTRHTKTARVLNILNEVIIIITATQEYSI